MTTTPTTVPEPAGAVHVQGLGAGTPQPRWLPERLPLLHRCGSLYLGHVNAPARVHPSS
jgi:hypothetical protein